MTEYGRSVGEANSFARTAAPEFVVVLALSSVPATLALLPLLSRYGCSCLTCQDVRGLVATLQACRADLVVVDAQLGGGQLVSLLQDISAGGERRVAVLGTGDEGLAHLDAVKVLDRTWPPELVGASLRMLIADRRAAHVDRDCSPHRLSWGDLMLDRRSRQAFRAAAQLPLTRHQFRLLWALCRARGGVVTIKELSHAVYGEQNGNDRERLFAHIRRIRRLIELDPSHPTVLVAVRGEGFRLADQPMASSKLTCSGGTATTW
jgi:DNA-binding response OmpR family regulator